MIRAIESHLIIAALYHRHPTKEPEIVADDDKCAYRECQEGLSSKEVHVYGGMMGSVGVPVITRMDC
jgi:hypothetical protein